MPDNRWVGNNNGGTNRKFDFILQKENDIVHEYISPQESKKAHESCGLFFFYTRLSSIIALRTSSQVRSIYSLFYYSELLKREDASLDA